MDQHSTSSHHNALHQPMPGARDTHNVHQSHHMPIGQQLDRPAYDTNNGGHFGASAAIANAGYAPDAGTFLGNGQFGNVSQGLDSNYKGTLATYWQNAIHELETLEHDYKQHHLPLARIKKVMKTDPDVKMISAEAPILFAKGCDIFITELTMRAWIHAEENKRRTLQKSDIASALSRSDMFDFLIDIVPREDTTQAARPSHTQPPAQGNPTVGAQTPSPEQIHGQPQMPSNQAHELQQAHELVEQQQRNDMVEQMRSNEQRRQQSQHTMTPADYTLEHSLTTQPDFRTNPGLYSDVPVNVSANYGYPGLDNIYTYPGQSIYQVTPQRLQDSMQGSTHNYQPRHQVGTDDPDADGDEEYDGNDA